MWLCGVPVRNDLVTVLARMLEDDGADNTAAIVHKAVANEQAIAALDVDDRMAILAVLYDAPDALEELRAVLPKSTCGGWLRGSRRVPIGVPPSGERRGRDGPGT